MIDDDSIEEKVSENTICTDSIDEFMLEVEHVHNHFAEKELREKGYLKDYRRDALHYITVFMPPPISMIDIVQGKTALDHHKPCNPEILMSTSDSIIEYLEQGK